MKIKEIIEEKRKLLIENDIEDSLIIVRQVICNILNKDKQYLIINSDEEISDINYNRINDDIKKIISGIPIQYIIKNQEFMGLNFYVDENVLIPQPDTEILVENVIEISKNILNEQGKIKILDLCTGSGAVAVSLYSILNKYYNKEQINVYASDISNKAIEVAKINNKNNNTNVICIESDLFKNISEKDFDIIVSNPPYIRTNIIFEELSDFVKNEPIIALDGGKDGLDFYRKIALNAKKFLNEKGVLAFEIGYNQKDAVIKILEENNYKNIYYKKDLSGNDRIVVGEV